MRDFLIGVVIIAMMCSYYLPQQFDVIFPIFCFIWAILYSLEKLINKKGKRHNEENNF